MSGWMLAVDFGTSNTAAAHTGILTGAPETLALTHQGNLMPSAVFVESPDNIEVGDVALNRAETNPGAFIASPKRVIGQSMVHANGYDLPTWVPAAAVLKATIAIATAAHRGQAPVRLVLTHPEGWSAREIGVLREAAANLGFDATRVATISEPRAAAHYYSRTETMPAGRTIAVFDFGGGTLDVAVLTANTAGSFDIVAARGDNALGGKNLDSLIRRWVDTHLAERNPALLDFVRRSAPMHVLRNLDDSIRRAKELLSTTPSATITVAGNGQQETLSLTRPEFDTLIAGETDRAIALTRAVFADAGIGHGGRDLSTLYLTGGSSRIPLIHQRLAELGPIATLDDPKTVVAQGALIALTQLGAGQSAPAASAPSTAPAALITQPAQQWQQVQSPRPQPAPQQSHRASSAAVPQQSEPGQWSPPQSPDQWSPPKSPSNVKTRVLAGAAVLIVIGVAAAAFLTLRPDNDTTETAAGGGSTSAPATTTGGPATDADTVKAALPATLTAASENCKQLTFTSAGTLVISCDIKKSSQLAKGFPEYGAHFTASVDPKESKKTFLGFREYDYKGYVITENSSGTAAVKIGSDSPGTTSGEFVNRDTGLSVNVFSMTDAASAENFFRTAGLL